MNERAILYRKMEGIPAEWGTAVSVQAMVFGNMGDTSATGVCFSRDAGNGEDLFNGEYLINAQGEDVVAGIRTPQQITKIGSSVGRNVLVFQKKTASPNILQWKKPCRKSINNWTNCKQSWKTIIMICRIWNSPYRKENCGSCKPVTEKYRCCNG